MASDRDSQAKKGAGGGAAADALTPPTMKNDPQGEQTMKYVPGEQATIQQAQNTIQAAPKTMPVAPRPSQPISSVPMSTQATFGARGSVTISNETGHQALAAGITLQDLTGERLLLSAPRTESHGRQCPTLNGIPLLAKIGQGGMGAVYYGIHPRLRSEVAVKVLPFTLAEQDPGMIRRFFREAQIAAQVHSPHLVNVTDVNEESGLFFLVMEFVSGCTAGQYMKSLIEKGASGLPELDALTLIVAATEGLRAAHDNNVIHRDIKPENIMIPYQSRTSREYELSRAKLMDLGLARSEDSQQSLTGAQAAMGTPGYMAPEQAMDAKSADKRSDVFSMGATLYALLTGRPPFKGETVMKVLMATMHEPHEPIVKVRPDISLAVNDLLERCLAKKQENRHTDARQLLGALEDCRRLLTGATAPGGMSAPRTMVYAASAATPAPAAAPSSGTEKTVLGGAGATPTPASQPGVVAPAAPRKKGLLYVIVAPLVLLVAVGAVYFPRGGGVSVKGSVAVGPTKPETAMDPKEVERLAKRHSKLINDAMESVKAGDPDEAKFTLGLAKGLSLDDQAARDREKQVETAVANFEKKKVFDKTLKDVEALVGKSDYQGAMTLLTQAIAKAPDDAASAAKADELDKKIRGGLRTAANKDSARKLLAQALELLTSKPGDALEKAQQLAAHSSARTTKVYDRRNDQVTLDEIERIAI
ncbi:MAG: protein kinase [Planctomycetota bacterium]|nr:protein kinase [Planctomycetota bacterium]